MNFNIVQLNSEENKLSINMKPLHLNIGLKDVSGIVYVDKDKSTAQI